VKKKLIIHIGPAKTGSTFIQDFMYNNKKLLETNKVLYPIAGDIKTGEKLEVLFKNKPIVHNNSLRCHHKLAWSLAKLVKGNYLDETIDELKNEISQSNCNKIFISSESFPVAHIQSLIYFKNAFEGYSFTITFLFRPIESWFKSIYNQDVKMGRANLSMSKHLKSIEIVDFNQCLNDWSEVFGTENINIIPFEYLHKEEMFKKTYEKILGVSLKEAVFNSEKVNESYDKNTLNAVLYLNAIQFFLSKFFSLDYPFDVLRNRINKRRFLYSSFKFLGGILPLLNNEKENSLFISEFKNKWYNDFLTNYAENKNKKII